MGEKNLDGKTRPEGKQTDVRPTALSCVFCRRVVVAVAAAASIHRLCQVFLNRIGRVSGDWRGRGGASGEILEPMYAHHEPKHVSMDAGWAKIRGPIRSCSVPKKFYQNKILKF